MMARWLGAAGTLPSVLRAVSVVTLLFHARTGRADASVQEEATRRAAVVARVGAKTLSVGELEDRLSAVPRFQLLEFGATPLAAKKKFLETVVIPEMLLTAAGEAGSHGKGPRTEALVERTRANATLRAVRAASATPERVAAADVKRYYDEHREQYEASERVLVWRIVLATRAEAQSVLEAAKKDLTVSGFSALARDKSLDKATNLRGGNVGFLSDDGISNEAGLRVEPTVVSAAKSVKDGELVPSPVADGAHFSVVWRRGTVKALRKPLSEVEPQIRHALARRASDQATKALVSDLKKARVGPLDAELVRATDLPSFLDSPKSLPLAK